MQAVNNGDGDDFHVIKITEPKSTLVSIKALVVTVPRKYHVVMVT